LDMIDNVIIINNEFETKKREIGFPNTADHLTIDNHENRQFSHLKRVSIQEN